MVDYVPKVEFRPHDLDGISEDQIALHWALYEGYVTNVNRLNKEVQTLVDAEQSGANPLFSELLRRKGWEYNGMLLHEYYFETMHAITDDPPANLVKSLTANFGSLENWKTEFNAIARMRGVGWAVLYQDPSNGALTNVWVEMHEQGHPVGFKPILVLDLWEHAFSVDWTTNPAGRGQYIEAYFKNVNWAKVASRLG
jgi:Fe-Mn family superoxide dismutase